MPSQTLLPFAAPRADRADPAAPAGPASGFHPLIEDWFSTRYGTPTPVQTRAWPLLRAGHDALIAAPTGSGKTLAAFMAAIDTLFVEALDGALAHEVRVVYVSPLKALSNDIHLNLETPLAEIHARALAAGYPATNIRSAVRSGDTGAWQRRAMLRQPPQILVTTPESLFILLGSPAGRRLLSTTRSVIVDELHALAGNKRGAHLSLSLERLDALCPAPPQRIGLSATQQPMSLAAELLMGAGRSCEIVDTGHRRVRDLAIETPDAPLAAVMAGEIWASVYKRLAELASTHRSTLIFVNQRRQAERIARHLSEHLGADAVTAHHGSLAKEHRLLAEQRLKRGELRALVATASLELGIDIGDVDLVCQIGSPRAINTFLQRVGRSGHAVNATPKGRLFPLSPDDLVECAALLDCVTRGELDTLELSAAPLDVLAQQIVAEAACQDWAVDALHARLCRARPYQSVSRETFLAVVQMLADGYATRRGRRGALLHYDAINSRVRGRRGAALTALTNAGTIPDQFDYDVILAPEDLRIGTLNEDFAFESVAGDIVQLGNASYRILKVETGRVRVEAAPGQPPNLPFWFGEAPGRSDALSHAVSRLREAYTQQYSGDAQHSAAWLRAHYALDAASARQLADYLDAACAALGRLPTQQDVIFERFFDEVGDTHLVIHAPLGSRILRAWGLALRKRFCRQFNFELQAAALDDSLVLSLGPTHSFPLEEVSRYLHSASAHEVLVQAVLQAPMFATRWRWAASTALAIPRFRGGRRVPPQFQRSDAEDLLTHAFPDAVACQDNLPGDREVPAHPLVQQTLADCLHELMDIDGLLRLLHSLEAGELRVHCRELTAPSPLSAAILNARPYAFLDDGAAEERRTLAVRSGASGQWEAPPSGSRLDAEAIARVDAELAPDPATADELHDALLVCGFLTETEIATWRALAEALLADRRAACLHAAQPLWVATERLHLLRAVLPSAPLLGNAPLLADPPEPADALHSLIQGRLEHQGPVSAAALAAPLGIDPAQVDTALLALEAQGSVMRGPFTADEVSNEADRSLRWCERRRLARIHRYTRERRRAVHNPVSPAAFLRFLAHWHGLAGHEPGPSRSGPLALLAVLEQLEGWPAAAVAWESELLPARLPGYDSSWLDQLCISGQIVWQRLDASSSTSGTRGGPVRNTPIVLLPRAHAAHWLPVDGTPELSGIARRVHSVLRDHGASFFAELVADSGLLRTQVEQALGELVSAGQVTADAFSGLRALLMPAALKAQRLRRGGLRASFDPLESAGRWSLLRRKATGNDGAAEAAEDAKNAASCDQAAIEHRVRVALRRYGVLFRALREREPQLPAWRDMLDVLRRMEAREEILGGRFVSGFAGEQFALPQAASTLRRYRDTATELNAGISRLASGDRTVIGACDPLNLGGILIPGPRIAAQPGQRLPLLPASSDA